MATSDPQRLRMLHRLWRALPAGPRRAALSTGAALLAPLPDRPAPLAQGGVAVGGEIGRASGLGEGARLMQAAMGQIGIDTCSIEAGMTVPGESSSQGLLSLPPAGWPLVLHVNAPVLPAALLRLPRRLVRGRAVVGYWAWELPVVPASWRPGVRFVHEIWTPSRFCAAAIEAVAPGMVRVVPHPLGACPPLPSRLGRADFALPEEAVVVLVSFSLASSFARKNPMAAIAAFKAAFGDRTDRMLLLKVIHPSHAPADMAMLREAASGAANIRFETRTLPAADSHALTACMDIVLSLHRSEGFGLVPAEAMLLGRPVVATDWSGTTDFLDRESGMPIGYTLVPARDPRGVFEAPGAVWAEADIGEAAAALRHLANDAGERRRLGEAGRAAATAKLGTAKLEAALAGLGFPMPAAA